MQPSLTTIANRYGTDKGTLGPSPLWPVHNYTDVYEAYLHPFRDKRINLLEIGLGVRGERCRVAIAHGRNADGGGSLRMWRDYFPRARIFGIDVNPATHLDDDRVSTAVVDQGDHRALSSFVESLGEICFDLIVDDGSHNPEDQQVSLATLFPHLAPGGLYFIEDLLANGLGDAVPAGSGGEPEVLCTRAVLRSFAADGEFARPNALSDCATLVAEIESVHFHAPAISTESAAGGGAGGHGIVRYPAATERLCVLRKRLGPVGRDNP